MNPPKCDICGTLRHAHQAHVFEAVLPAEKKIEVVPLVKLVGEIEKSELSAFDHCPTCGTNLASRRKRNAYQKKLMERRRERKNEESRV